MFRFAIIMMLTLLISGPLCSQSTNSISGKIYSTSGDILSGIHVAIEGTKLYSISDNNGKYLLQNLSAGRHQVVVTGIGYLPQRITTEITSNQVTTLDINMVSQTYTMPGVDIIAGKNHLFTNVPGSLNYLSPLEIQAVQPV
ncbi:MAG: carboxypeptidase-like regulatory domain-containing protein, partial [Bacteroidota bacterium]|nr:carboxypeptidase-like regulatory domain-containing protein [Bacteroidota bacterium]